MDVLKRYSLMALLLCCGIGAWADNTISLSSVQGNAGTEVTISVTMTNSDAVSALQLSIPLGDNLTFVANSQKAGSRLSGHTLSAGVNDGVLNLMVYSTSMTAISGNGGEVCSFKLLLGNNPGTINLNPSKIALLDSNGSSLTGSVSAGAIDVRGAKAKFYYSTLNCGKVAINSSVRNYFFVINGGNEPLTITSVTFSSTIFSTTSTLPMTIDAGSTGCIYVVCSPTALGTIDEEMTIVSNSVTGQSVIRLTATPYGLNELSLGYASGVTDEEVTINVSMTNYDEITGLQMDIEMPNELEYVDGSFELSSRKQDHAATASVSDGILSLVAYSVSDKPFTGTEGVVGSFKVKIVGSNNAYLNIKNAKLVSTIDGKTVDVLSGKSGSTVTVKGPNLYTYDSIDFGRVSVNQKNVKQLFTIRNFGEAPLTISDIAFANGQFRISESLPMTIQASSSKDITVVCQATESGDISTNMEIYSNDPNKRLHIVKVNCNVFTPDYLTAVIEASPEEVNLSVSLDNYSDIYGIQFDIDTDQEFTASDKDVTLTERGANLSVGVSSISGGKLRVVAYCKGGQSIASGKGKVMTIKLVPKQPLADGDYLLTLSDIVLGDKDLNNKYEGLAQQEIAYSTQPFIVGDANGDKSVDVMDVVLTVDYILNRHPANFVFKAADVDANNVIDVSDVVGIVNIILHNNSGSNVRSKDGYEDTANDRLSLVQNEDGLSLCLDNQAHYVAAQFDLKLTDGQLLENVLMNDSRSRNHQVVYAELEKSCYRVLIYAVGNNVFQDNQGELVRFRLGDGTDNAEVSHIRFVTSRGETKEFDSLYYVSTDVNRISQANVFDIYSTSGALLRRNATSTEGLKKGVYIINNHKIVIK